jgi:hypothetical protein
VREIIGYWKLKEEALDHNLWRIALEETTDLSKDIRRMIRTKKLKQSVTGLERPRGFQEVKIPRFHDNGTGWW